MKAFLILTLAVLVIALSSFFNKDFQWIFITIAIIIGFLGIKKW